MSDAVEEKKRAIDAGMRRYAEFDKSDPFTLARCMAHQRMGMLGSTDEGSQGHYDAERDATGRRNVARM